MKKYILILITFLSITSYSQEYLGKSYDDVMNKISKNVYVDNYRTQGFTDSTVIFVYYNGFIKTYICAKNKKVIGEMLITDSEQLSTYLCQYYDHKCFKETETIWYYRGNRKVIQTSYDLVDIENKNYHVFHTSYK